MNKHTKNGGNLALKKRVCLGKRKGRRKTIKKSFSWARFPPKMNKHTKNGGNIARPKFEIIKKLKK